MHMSINIPVSLHSEISTIHVGNNEPQWSYELIAYHACPSYTSSEECKILRSPCHVRRPFTPAFSDPEFGKWGYVRSVRSTSPYRTIVPACTILKDSCRLSGHVPPWTSLPFATSPPLGMFPWIRSASRLASATHRFNRYDHVLHTRLM